MSRGKNSNKTIGYCPMCMQNVEHTRLLSIGILRILDVMSLGIPRFFRLGPWYCYQCEGRSLYLRPFRRNAPTFDSELLKSGFQSRFDSTPIVAADPDVAMAVGNYLKTEQSLVMRDKRSRKFSQKFRDAAVIRVLKGGSSIREICHELGVKEPDLIGWMSSLLSRKQERIDELTMALEAVRANLPDRLKFVLETKEPETVENDGAIVEGHVAPR